ncbi:potassium channel family protein [Metapseudomonas boanensis]|uniref:Two pore domain potassium channel family protein n=1 Tax=Metapseudomonas boanensis TaxID=2822138 RepID=A0ABS5XKM8_9GAMM|nr:potassium channel family protein [Pseudomonas boanensis]MBT8768269.1 two pore domain potassium channel family protein [Pseudomonas boanensis]
MLLNLLVGIPVMLLCLLMQAYFVSLCLRQYVRFRKSRQGHDTQFLNAALLSLVMLLMLLGNFAQMAIWALLFWFLGEFGQFATALYHSGVNFATLGYGDIVMSETWRLLGPLEAANGILMFGVSTAVMTGAVMDIIKYQMAQGREH